MAGIAKIASGDNHKFVAVADDNCDSDGFLTGTNYRCLRGSRQ
jgi:hypothetical protein